jgi:flagellar biosynthesis GTPase FlhF
LEAYLRLPEGWTTTPTGLPTDQFMWTKFAREPWCRIRALQWPVSLHFPAPDRRNWTDQQRVDELARWTEIIARPDGREHVYRAMLRTFGHILLEQSLATVQQHTAASAALEREQTLRAKAQAERDAEQTQREAERTKAEAERNSEQTLRARAETERAAEQTQRAKAEAERDAEQTLRAKAQAERDAEQTLRAKAQAERNTEQMLRAQAEAERDAFRESTFWRLTTPLRATINFFKGLLTG